MCLKWMDKMPVAMLSTIHSNEVSTKHRRTRSKNIGMKDINRPVVVDEYNKYMGEVDHSDQMILSYGYAHR